TPTPTIPPAPDGAGTSREDISMDASDLNTNNVITGTWGNGSKARARIAGQPTAAAVLRFMKVPTGSTPLDLRVAVLAALGGGCRVPRRPGQRGDAAAGRPLPDGHARR